jgi:flagellar basal body rod protein FlgC
MESGASIPLLSLAARSMETERGMLDLFARNIAAAQAAGPEGFTRLEPVPAHDEDGAPFISSVRAHRVRNGSIVTEMLAVMQAQRAYESDATMFSLGKHLAEQTIAIERT